MVNSNDSGIVGAFPFFFRATAKRTTIWTMNPFVLLFKISVNELHIVINTINTGQNESSHSESVCCWITLQRVMCSLRRGNSSRENCGWDALKWLGFNYSLKLDLSIIEAWKVLKSSWDRIIPGCEKGWHPIWKPKKHSGKRERRLRRLHGTLHGRLYINGCHRRCVWHVGLLLQVAPSQLAA